MNKKKQKVAHETVEPVALVGKSDCLDPGELGLLAKRLGKASDPAEAARIKERLARGFYGSRSGAPRLLPKQS